MSNQSFSKIWIVVVLVVIIGGGILAWQYWWPSKEEFKPQPSISLESYDFPQPVYLGVSQSKFSVATMLKSETITKEIFESLYAYAQELPSDLTRIVVYSRYNNKDSDKQDLYWRDLKTLEEHRLTTDDFDNLNPKIDSVSQKVVYQALLGKTEPPELIKELRSISLGNNQINTLKSETLAGGGDIRQSFTVRNGKLAFLSNNNKIIVVDLTSGEQKIYSVVLSGEKWTIGNLAWSIPDQKIYFEISYEKEFIEATGISKRAYDVGVLNLENGETKMVLQSPDSELAPFAYHPDTSSYLSYLFIKGDLYKWTRADGIGIFNLKEAFDRRIPITDGEINQYILSPANRVIYFLTLNGEFGGINIETGNELIKRATRDEPGLLNFGMDSQIIGWGANEEELLISKSITAMGEKPCNEVISIKVTNSLETHKLFDTCLPR